MVVGGWCYNILYRVCWRAMQVQQQPLLKNTIINYQNVTNQLKLNNRDNPAQLYVYGQHMQVRFEGKVVDVHNYKDLLYMQPMERTRQFVAIIHEKKLDRATISMRMPYGEIAFKIYNFVTRQIELVSNKPTQTPNLNYRRELIKKLRLKHKHIYNPIYDANEKMLNPEWLDSFLFEDYQEIKEFNQLARQNAYQLQRKLILAKIRNTIDQSNKNQNTGLPDFTPKNLDIVKCDEGVRYYDDSKKLKLVLKEDDKEDDLIGEALPDVIRPEIFDNFDKLQIRGEPMEIESEGGKLVSLQSDRTHQKSIKLARIDKDRYKLTQHKELQIKRANKGKDEKPKDELRFDEEQATKARAWMKIFYQIQHHSMVTVIHLDLISAELNKILYSEPKLPIYLEQAITKTQHNLLAFKRARSADFQ